MDLTIYLNMIVSAIWYLIPIFIFAVIIKSAWFKGLIGELQVNLLIKFFLEKNDYHLIKNVTLLTEDGTTQIDHIIVSKFGIFVVETKNMKGWIFGSENQKQWTQQIFKHKSKFQNPLHQNYKHVKTLEDCLSANEDTIFSVIIFIGDCSFKTKKPENVKFARGGIEYIKSKTDIVFNGQEVADVIEQIESGRLERSYRTNRQHVKHVRDIVKNKSETKTCVKCGSEMVLRKATKGKNEGSDFWGCSAFPKCRYVTESC
ncbi:nuclease-related domain-containing protein [Pseudoalteromonas spongiae]|uniref:nuclease-related domain-containing protein n=1 Tax=Pseudoalteromonas spongiae TaxID=298657 RepID=UPI00110B0460|nr:NERD domain-containing protein [Pseudoalteromonas spongiae]TMO81727.1 nuclease [Pseudoalteromonas spongiae]